MTAHQKHTLSQAAIFAGLLLQGSAIAGANTAKVECTTAHAGARAVRVTGEVPATIEDLDLTISLGTSSTRFNSENSDAFTVEDFAKGVYTLTLRMHGTNDTTILYAVPSSVIHKKIPNGMFARFVAYLETPIPGRTGPVQSSDDMLHSVKLSCTYRYEI